MATELRRGVEGKERREFLGCAELRPAGRVAAVPILACEPIRDSVRLLPVTVS